MDRYAVADVRTVKSRSNTSPFPNILPARSRSPCPNAMAAKGAPPAPTIEEKAEIRMMTELVTPIPANASVPIPGIWPM